jgi:1,4-dihydroxy-2-naphthoyl-CoA synthase
LAGAESAASAGAEATGDQKFETLAVSNAGGIYSITLNRPNKKNAITVQVRPFELCVI